MTAQVLAAVGLVVRFGATTAVAGVDLDVMSGESVAIVGPSGSGKSSLMHCLAGLIVPAEGSVHLGRHDLGACNAEQRAEVRRNDVGFVFQFADLVPELSLLDNVALACELVGASRRDAVRRASEELERLGVGGLMSRRPGQVSGGERQRAAVGRALVHRPKVVFADEPTGALDTDNGVLVMDQLLGAASDAGAAVVVVTHDQSVAGRCSRALTMRDGHLEAALDGATAP
ncbi:MAG: ABC transporter ATP-binding protein [Aquihabitans sp.]